MSSLLKNEQNPEIQRKSEHILKLLFGYSKLFCLLLLTAFMIVSWNDIRALIPRISQFEAFGVKVELSELKSAFEKQLTSEETPKISIKPDEIEAVLARAIKVQSVFEGATILWVDDRPENNLPFRQLLRELGAGVEPARSNKEALKLASIDSFDLIVSDIKREEEIDTGIDGLKLLRSNGVKSPLIFYVFQVDPSLPTPSDALGITNRPDTLLHLIIDGLERSRWSSVE